MRVRAQTLVGYGRVGSLGSLISPSVLTAKSARDQQVLGKIVKLVEDDKVKEKEDDKENEGEDKDDD